jgi:RimJ/RimL family protein N-acetyltransferase
LLLRPFTTDDIPAFLARRNDPEVARYQDWELPYPPERATELVSRVIEMGEPTDGEWWMAVVCDLSTGEVFGDVGCDLSWGGRTAELGYTFAKEHWGKGSGVEAVEALVRYLFEDRAVTRVWGQLHPDNPASAMVLERSGLLFEGHTKSSFWLGDEVSDDWLYGMTRVDWETWRDRPRHRPQVVRLVEMGEVDVWEVYKLRTHKTQEEFVATMAESYADALFPEVVDGAPLVPWMRAVLADGDLVGFVMLALRTEHHPLPYLWRLLIDRLHQRRGIGSRVLDLVAAECMKTGSDTLLTSWGEGKGSPRHFYLNNGFEPTGRVVDDETEGRRHLAGP